MSTIDIRFDGSLFTDSSGEALSILLLASEDVLQLGWFSDASSPSVFLPDDYVWWFVSAGRNPIQSQDVSGDITGRFSTNRDDDSITGGTITVAPKSTDEGDDVFVLSSLENTKTKIMDYHEDYDRIEFGDDISQTDFFYRYHLETVNNVPTTKITLYASRDDAAKDYFAIIGFSINSDASSITDLNFSDNSLTFTEIV